MKNVLPFFIIFILFSFIKLQKLSLTSHTSNKFPIKTGTYMDLINVNIECPNYGVFKNFIIRKGNGYFWFEYQCYSAQTPKADYGEPIIKQVLYTGHKKHNFHLYNGIIQYLNDYELCCLVDYGLKGFHIFIADNILKTDVFCHGLKVTYTSKVMYATTAQLTSGNSLEGFFNILVGRTDTETDVDIGFPLRGFKFVVDTSKSRYYPTVYFVYAYSKLRKMSVVADAYKKKFEELRNSNNQKN